MSKFIVTITPPTPNGDLHLGHISGPFLAADVCTRVLRQQGRDALLLCYSDDYQSYLQRKGREAGRDPRQIASENATAIHNSLRSVDIQLDHFLKSFDNATFLDEVSRYFTMLQRSANLQTRRVAIPYCDACNVFGYEGFGRGRCNHCGAPSDASQCEACARVPVMSAMGAMTCVLCRSEMRPRDQEALLWRIGRHYAGLRKHYENARHRPALAQYLREVLSNDGDEWLLSRPGEASIPVRDHVEQVHTWFAGLPGYRATLREHLTRQDRVEDLASWWCADTTLVQFLGFDCTYSHAVAYASMLIEERDAPQTIHHFTNRFLKLDGEDFSTSRNHAIWVRELAAQFPADAIRLYTALRAPENEVRNFSRVDFREWFDDRFCRVLNGAWRSSSTVVAELSAHVHAQYNSIVAAWRSAVSLEKFSISAMAQVQMRLLELSESAPISDRGFLWLAFSELGKALHPQLSIEIRSALLERSRQSIPAFPQLVMA
jgi:methionyl-tRNA synthetase